MEEGKRTDANARAIHDVDQRLATLQHVREVVQRNTTALVESIASAVKRANDESFGEAEADIRAEEAAILRDERRRARGE